MAENFTAEQNYQREQLLDNLIINFRDNPDAVSETLRNMEFSERQHVIPPQWEVLESGVLLIHHYLDADKLRKAIEDARSKNFNIDTIAFASDVRQVTADCFALADKDCGVVFDENGNRTDSSNVCFTRFEDYSDFPTTNGDNSSFEIRGSRAEGLFSHLGSLRQICFFGHGACEQRAAGHPISLIGDDSKVESLILGTTGGSPYIAERSFASNSRALGAVVNLNLAQVVNFGKNAFSYSRDEDELKNGIELLENKPHLGKKYENAEEFIDSLTEEERKYVKAHPHFGLEYVQKSRDAAVKELKNRLEEIRGEHIPIVRNRCDDIALYNRALERKAEDLVNHRRAIENEKNFLIKLRDEVVSPKNDEYEEALKQETGLLHVNQEALKQMSANATLLELNKIKIGSVKKQIEKNEQRIEVATRASQASKLYLEGIETRLEELDAEDDKFLHELHNIESQKNDDMPFVSASLKKASEEGRLYLGLDNMDMSNIEDRAFLNTSVQSEPIKDNARAVLEAQLDDEYDKNVKTFVKVASLMDSLIIDRENFIKSDVYESIKRLSDEKTFYSDEIDFASIREDFEVLLGRVNEYDLPEKSKEIQNLVGLGNPAVKRNIAKYADNLMCDLESCRASLVSIGGMGNIESRKTIRKVLGENYDNYLKAKEKEREKKRELKAKESAKQNNNHAGKGNRKTNNTSEEADAVRDIYEKGLVEDGIIGHDLLLLSRQMKLKKNDRAEVEKAFRTVFSNRRERQVISRAWGTRTGKQSFFNSDINAVIDSDADRIIRKRNEIAKKLNALQQKNDEMAKKIQGWDGTSWGQAFNAEIRNLKFELDGLQKAPRTKEADKEAFAMNDKLGYISTDFEMRDGVYAFDGNEKNGLVSYDRSKGVGEKGGIDLEKLNNKECKNTFNNSFIHDLKIASINGLKWALSLNMLSFLGGRRLTFGQSLLGMTSGAAVAVIAITGAVCKSMFGPFHNEENNRLTDCIIKNALADSVTDNNKTVHVPIKSGPSVLFDGKYAYVDSSGSSFGQLESRIRDYQKWQEEYEKLFASSKTDSTAAGKIKEEDGSIAQSLFSDDKDKKEKEDMSDENEGLRQSIVPESTQESTQEITDDMYGDFKNQAENTSPEIPEAPLNDSLDM